MACRNCIITTNSIVKISCIALSKDKYSNEYFKHNNKAIPLRHLAPEILDSGAFSLASDLYACGFVLWEVLSRGALPFDELVPSDDEFLQQLSDHSLDYTSFVENEKIPNDLRKVLVRIVIYFQCLSLDEIVAKNTKFYGCIFCYFVILMSRPL